MLEDHPREQSWLVELLKLLGDLLRPARDFAVETANWTIKQVRDYLAFLWRSAIRAGAVCLFATLLAVIGAFTNLNWLVSISLIVAGLVIAILLLLAFPFVTLAARFSEFRSVQMAMKFGLWILTWFFGMALLVSVVPLSPAGIGVVVLGSLVLSLLCVVTGTKPNLDKLRARAASLVIFTVLAAIAQQAFPQLASNTTRVVSSLDRAAARWLSTEILPPRSVHFRSSDECWEEAFFDQEGGELYWYDRTPEGRLLLFDREGISPFTRRPLIGVTPDVREEFCGSIKAPARKSDEPRLKSPTAAGLRPTVTDEPRAGSASVGGSPIAVTPNPGAAAQDPGYGAPSLPPAMTLETERETMEALVEATSLQPFTSQPTWLRELSGRTVAVSYSSRSRDQAAVCIKRLRSLGLNVVLDPVADGATPLSPSIEYTHSDIHAASSLNALLGDLARWDLNSHRAMVPLRITLP